MGNFQKFLDWLLFQNTYGRTLPKTQILLGQYLPKKLRKAKIKFCSAGADTDANADAGMPML